MDMDSNYEGNSGFVAGTSVVIEADERIYMGDIISIGGFGVHFLETHRLEKVGGATEKDLERWVEAFKEMSDKDLRKHARNVGLGFFSSLLATRMALVEFCVNDMIEAKNLGIHDEMVTLTRPVETLLRTKDYSMRSTEDYGFEASLRELDFDTAEEKGDNDG